jgi:hypothetical protein
MIGTVAAEGFDAVARGIEEVDGGSTRDAVTAGAIIDAYLVHRQNIGGAKQRISRVYHEGCMLADSSV